MSNSHTLLEANDTTIVLDEQSLNFDILIDSGYVSFQLSDLTLEELEQLNNKLTEVINQYNGK